MLARVVYVSRAAKGVTLEDVYGIIRTAHARNEREDLGGALLFLDGCFVQVLEGPVEQLKAAFERIRADERHAAVSLRMHTPALCRLFPRERMALRACRDLDPRLLEDFGYSPGFPVERFPVDVLLEFVLRVCSRHRDRGRLSALG